MRLGIQRDEERIRNEMLTTNDSKKTNYGIQMDIAIEGVHHHSQYVRGSTKFD